jgi:hypothetical protein
MNLTRKEYETKGEKQFDFIIGIAIWIVANGLFMAGFFAFSSLSVSVNQIDDPALYTVASIGILVCTVGPFLANIAGIIFLAIYRRWMAFGMLSAIGALMVLVMCLGVMIIGACGFGLAGMNL